MEGAQVHWQAGQGDKERRGGEEGLGLRQKDPDGEMGVDKERGERGRQEEASWVTKDSLLGEVITDSMVLPEGEEGMVMQSEEGTRVMLVVEVGGLEQAVI